MSQSSVRGDFNFEITLVIPGEFSASIKKVHYVIVLVRVFPGAALTTGRF